MFALAGSDLVIYFSRSVILKNVLTSGCLFFAWITFLLLDPVGNFEKRIDFWVSAFRVGHFLLSDLAGNFEKRLDFWMSASRVGHCLLSDPAGNFEKRLDFWVSAFRVGHFLLSDPAGNLKSVLTSGCLPFA